LALLLSATVADAVMPASSIGVPVIAHPQQFSSREARAETEEEALGNGAFAFAANHSTWPSLTVVWCSLLRTEKDNRPCEPWHATQRSVWKTMDNNTHSVVRSVRCGRHDGGAAVGLSGMLPDDFA
jgi:hypothetical protein